MPTCPNCRYQVRPGGDACPMCGTDLSGAVGRANRRPLALACIALAIAGLVVAGTLVRPRRTTATSVAGRTGRPPPGCGAAPRTRTPAKKTYAAPPSERLGPARSYTLQLRTTCGRIDIALDVARAPVTTSSVAFLVRQGFYDGLAFHGIIPGVAVLAGDPTGTGQGGPGYTVTEAPPADLRYTSGIVAMYRQQAEADGTSGSQFFIVSGPGAAELPQSFALLGKVVKGMDVVSRINATKPTQQRPVILKARIVERSAASP